MKNGMLINAPISALVSEMGHTDTLTICDSGLPTYDLRRIDLALSPGVPGFLETVETILAELQVENAYLSEDIVQKNPAVLAGLKKLLGDTSIELIPHVDFKEKVKTSKGIVRTGECTPFANVILVAGVTFKV